MKFILNRCVSIDRNEFNITLKRLRPFHTGRRILSDQTIAVGAPVVKRTGNKSPDYLTGRIKSEGYRNLIGGESGNDPKYDEETNSELVWFPHKIPGVWKPFHRKQYKQILDDCQGTFRKPKQKTLTAFLKRSGF